MMENDIDDNAGQFGAPREDGIYPLQGPQHDSLVQVSGCPPSFQSMDTRDLEPPVVDIFTEKSRVSCQMESNVNIGNYSQTSISKHPQIRTDTQHYNPIQTDSVKHGSNQLGTNVGGHGISFSSQNHIIGDNKLETETTSQLEIPLALPPLSSQYQDMMFYPDAPIQTHPSSDINSTSVHSVVSPITSRSHIINLDSDDTCNSEQDCVLVESNAQSSSKSELTFGSLHDEQAFQDQRHFSAFTDCTMASMTATEMLSVVSTGLIEQTEHLMDTASVNSDSPHTGFSPVANNIFQFSKSSNELTSVATTSALTRSGPPSIHSDLSNDESFSIPGADTSSMYGNSEADPDENRPPLSYELQQGLRILREIMAESNKSINWPFMNPVDSSLEGCQDYYELVKQPIWLRKMRDKFDYRDYSSITEYVADMRLMLENCYRYNGPDHAISKKAQRLETMMEQKLALLSREMREKTSIAATSGIPVEETRITGTRRRKAIVPHDSTALLNQLRLEAQERGKETRRQLMAERKQAQEAYAQELHTWEDQLFKNVLREQMKAMWELPQIGHFLFLCVGPLNIGEVAQWELERCFLMPRESSTMQRIMTGLLSTPYQRTRLDRKPMMPYNVWEDKLKTRLRHWYKLLTDSSRDVKKTVAKLGLDEKFFEVLGLRFPLEKKKFHELSYYRKVWIVKGLCDWCLETQESIREAIEAQPITEQRSYWLGKDGDGNTFVHFPQFCGADLRIYRQVAVHYESRKVKQEELETPKKIMTPAKKTPRKKISSVASTPRSSPAPPRGRDTRLRQNPRKAGSYRRNNESDTESQSTQVDDDDTQSSVMYSESDDSGSDQESSGKDSGISEEDSESEPPVKSRRCARRQPGNSQKTKKEGSTSGKDTDVNLDMVIESAPSRLTRSAMRNLTQVFAADKSSSVSRESSPRQQKGKNRGRSQRQSKRSHESTPSTHCETKSRERSPASDSELRSKSTKKVAKNLKQSLEMVESPLKAGGDWKTFAENERAKENMAKKCDKESSDRKDDDGDSSDKTIDCDYQIDELQSDKTLNEKCDRSMDDPVSIPNQEGDAKEIDPSRIETSKSDLDKIEQASTTGSHTVDNLEAWHNDASNDSKSVGEYNTNPSPLPIGAEANNLSGEPEPSTSHDVTISRNHDTSSAKDVESSTQDQESILESNDAHRSNPEASNKNVIDLDDVESLASTISAVDPNYTADLLDDSQDFDGNRIKHELTNDEERGSSPVPKETDLGEIITDPKNPIKVEDSGLASSCQPDDSQSQSPNRKSPELAATSPKTEINSSESNIGVNKTEPVDQSTADESNIIDTKPDTLMETTESSGKSNIDYTNTIVIKPEPMDTGNTKDGIKKENELSTASQENKSGVTPLEEEEEFKEVLPITGEFTMVADCLDSLRALIAQFDTEMDTNSQDKKQKGPRCVIELHKQLVYLLQELEPWDQKLSALNRKALVKMKKEWESYEEEPEKTEIIDVWESEESASEESESEEEELVAENDEQDPKFEVRLYTDPNDTVGVTTRGGSKRRKNPSSADQATSKRRKKVEKEHSPSPAPNILQKSKGTTPPSHPALKAALGNIGMPQVQPKGGSLAFIGNQPVVLSAGQLAGLKNSMMLSQLVSSQPQGTSVQTAVVQQPPKIFLASGLPGAKGGGSGQLLLTTQNPALFQQKQAPQGNQSQGTVLIAPSTTASSSAPSQKVLLGAKSPFMLSGNQQLVLGNNGQLCILQGNTPPGTVTTNASSIPSTKEPTITNSATKEQSKIVPTSSVPCFNYSNISQLPAPLIQQLLKNQDQRLQAANKVPVIVQTGEQRVAKKSLPTAFNNLRHAGLLPSVSVSQNSILQTSKGLVSVARPQPNQNLTQTTAVSQSLTHGNAVLSSSLLKTSTRDLSPIEVADSPTADVIDLDSESSDTASESAGQKGGLASKTTVQEQIGSKLLQSQRKSTLGITPAPMMLSGDDGSSKEKRYATNVTVKTLLEMKLAEATVRNFDMHMNPTIQSTSATVSTATNKPLQSGSQHNVNILSLPPTQLKSTPQVQMMNLSMQRPPGPIQLIQSPNLANSSLLSQQLITSPNQHGTMLATAVQQVLANVPKQPQMQLVPTSPAKLQLMQGPGGQLLLVQPGTSISQPVHVVQTPTGQKLQVLQSQQAIQLLQSAGARKVPSASEIQTTSQAAVTPQKPVTPSATQSQQISILQKSPVLEPLPAGQPSPVVQTSPLDKLQKNLASPPVNIDAPGIPSSSKSQHISDVQKNLLKQLPSKLLGNPVNVPITNLQRTLGASSMVQQSLIVSTSHDISSTSLLMSSKVQAPIMTTSKATVSVPQNTINSSAGVISTAGASLPVTTKTKLVHIGASGQTVLPLTPQVAAQLQVALAKKQAIDNAIKTVITSVSTSLPTAQIKVSSPFEMPSRRKHRPVTITTSAMKAPISAVPSDLGVPARKSDPSHKAHSMPSSISGDSIIPVQPNPTEPIHSLCTTATSTGILTKSVTKSQASLLDSDIPIIPPRSINTQMVSVPKLTTSVFQPSSQQSTTAMLISSMPQIPAIASSVTSQVRADTDIVRSSSAVSQSSGQDVTSTSIASSVPQKTVGLRLTPQSVLTNKGMVHGVVIPNHVALTPAVIKQLQNISQVQGLYVFQQDKDGNLHELYAGTKQAAGLLPENLQQLKTQHLSQQMNPQHHLVTRPDNPAMVVTDNQQLLQQSTMLIGSKLSLPNSLASVTTSVQQSGSLKKSPATVQKLPAAVLQSTLPTQQISPSHRLTIQPQQKSASHLLTVQPQLASTELKTISSQQVTSQPTSHLQSNYTVKQTIANPLQTIVGAQSTSAVHPTEVTNILAGNIVQQNILLSPTQVVKLPTGKVMQLGQLSQAGHTVLKKPARQKVQFPAQVTKELDKDSKVAIGNVAHVPVVSQSNIQPLKATNLTGIANVSLPNTLLSAQTGLVKTRFANVQFQPKQQLTQDQLMHLMQQQQQQQQPQQKHLSQAGITPVLTGKTPDMDQAKKATSQDPTALTQNQSRTVMAQPLISTAPRPVLQPGDGNQPPKLVVYNVNGKLMTADGQPVNLTQGLVKIGNKIIGTQAGAQQHKPKTDNPVPMVPQVSVTSPQAVPGQFVQQRTAETVDATGIHMLAGVATGDSASVPPVQHHNADYDFTSGLQVLANAANLDAMKNNRNMSS